MVPKTLIFLTLFFVTDAFHLHRYQDDVTEHENWPLLDLKDVCGRSTTWWTRKTIGGHNADLAEYPWMARLIYRQSMKNNGETGLCGGSVINKRYVLTAAHCCTTVYDGGLSYVKLGEFDIHHTKDCRRGKCSPPPLEIGIEEIVMHHKYDSNSLKNDICLLRLSEDIEFSDYVKPICLPTSKDMMERSFVGSTLTVAGWGYLEQEPETRTPEVLQEVRVRVLSDKKCPDLEEFEESTHICAGDAQIQDSCAGDSGGPLMYTTEEGGAATHYLVGLVSSGPPCSHELTAYSPGYYTKVSKYIDWILDTIY